MSKKMKIPSIFKNREAKQPWQWPSCKHPKTLSFRGGDDNNNMMTFKTVNSIYHDQTYVEDHQTPESWFTNTSESASFSTDEFSQENTNPGAEWLETVVRGVRQSERLFFEPGDTSSIVKVNDQKNHQGALPFKESVALALESSDPYMDFKKSMQEMVESQGLKDWDCLEELLGWYLKMNGKMNHRYIVGAFADLLLGLASSASDPTTESSAILCCNSDDSTSYSSAASSFASSPPSPTLVVGPERAIDEENIVLQP